MRRWGIALLAVLAVAVVGSSGYLGARSAQGEATSTIEAPTTVAVTRGEVQQTVTAPGQLVVTRHVELAVGAGGKLTQIHARPGEPVQAGSVLAQIDPALLAARVAAAQADLEVAGARLAQLQAGPTIAEVAAAQLALAQAEANLHRIQAGASAADLASGEADVAAAEKDLAYLRSQPDPARVAQVRAELERAEVALLQAQAAYDQVKDRSDVGMTLQARTLQEATIAYQGARAALEAASRPATPVELKAAEARLAAAQAELAELEEGASDDELRLAELQRARAEADLEQLRLGPPSADLMQAQAVLQAAELALEQAQTGLAAATLVAPFDGVVLAVHAEPGETVGAGTRLVLLADPAAIEIETNVIEEDLPLVQVGQAAYLFFDARPDAEVQGRVARIVPQRLASDRPLYPVYIAVEDLPAGLLAGMTVDASIVVASRSDVLRLPRAVVRARSNGTATVQVWTGSSIEERLIQSGLRGDVYVEIVDGLREGEQVVSQ